MEKKNIIKKRAETLRTIGNNNLEKFLKKQIGKKIKVLIEQVTNSISIGKSQHFTKIEINDVIKEGEIVHCMITNINKGVLNAHII